MDDRPSIETIVDDVADTLGSRTDWRSDCYKPEPLSSSRPMERARVESLETFWGTLGCLENFLLRERDGVIYNGKGVYDADRKTLAGEAL